MLDKLFEDVDEREDSGKLAIDADSLLYLSCYKHREDFDIELAYFDFAGRIKAIEIEMYKKVTQVEDIKLCLTPKKNFRNDIYPEYKANRKKVETDESKQLKEYVRELKALAYKRLKKICFINNQIEADDGVIMFAYKGYYVSAMDSDVVNQCPTPVFNFHAKKWKWQHEGKTDKEIFTRVLLESMKGKSKDNVKGIKGCGEVKAKEYVEQILNADKSFQDYVELFDIPEEMLLNYRLCDVSQYKNGKLELVSIEDIANKFTDYVNPF